MKALILDGSYDENSTIGMIRQAIEKKLKSCNWELEVFTLRNKEVAPCLGCFNCWIKTPGICIINDAGQDIVKHASQSDLWIFLTPVLFGGYSSVLKQAVDRLLPIFIPIFTKYRNEVHHKWRPKKTPHLIALGVAPIINNSIEQIFKRVIQRNAINFHSPSQSGEIFTENESKDRLTKKIEMSLNNITV